MAGNNIYQGQIQGPFKAGQSLMNLIKEQSAFTPKYLSHIGIQTPTENVVKHPDSLVELNISGGSYTIEIGKTGIYEIGNTRVYDIKFLDNKDNNTIVDYTIVY